MQTESHEPAEVAAGAIAALLVSVCAGLLATGLGLAWLFRMFEHNAESMASPASPFAAQRSSPPGPRLQVAPKLDLHELRIREEAVLGGWASTDDIEFVQVPLERALNEVADTGLPRWPKVALPDSENPRKTREP